MDLFISTARPPPTSVCVQFLIKSALLQLDQDMEGCSWDKMAMTSELMHQLTKAGWGTALEKVILDNKHRQTLSQNLIADILPGLKHHTIHCLSIGSSLRTLVGFSVSEFSELFLDVLPKLKERWPRCPVTAGPEDRPKFGTLRFKLLLTLARLRRYQSYRQMQVTHIQR